MRPPLQIIGGFNLTHALFLLGLPDAFGHQAALDAEFPCVVVPNPIGDAWPAIDGLLMATSSTTGHGYSVDCWGYGRVPVGDYGNLYKDRQFCLWEAIRRLHHEWETKKRQMPGVVSAAGSAAGSSAGTAADMALVLEEDESELQSHLSTLLQYAIWSMEFIFLRGVFILWMWPESHICSHLAGHPFLCARPFLINTGKDNHLIASSVEWDEANQKYFERMSE